MRLGIKLLCISLLSLAGSFADLDAQVDSLAVAKADSLRSLPADSSKLKKDTVPQSKNALEAPVNYQAADSIIMTATNRAYLYGKSDVKYQKIELGSEIIEMSLDSSLVYAKYGIDSVGEEFGWPLFKEGSDQYESRSMRYNFKSKKGFITDVITQQGEGYVTAVRTKKEAGDVMNMTGGEYTTCDDHDDPHFYFKMTRAKVRPKKNIVTGPVYLVLADVPLYPIGLPFCYFPFSSTYSSGILFPTFGEESTRGFYMRDGGYYFAINDYMDLALTGELYSKGSWGVTARTTLKKRYKYNGSFNGSYLVTKLGDKGLPDYSLTKDLKLTGTFSVDPKSAPYHTFSISANFATTGYDRNDVQGLYSPTSTQNTKSSSVSYSKRFPNSPFSFTMASNINQVTSDTTLAMTLPDMNITMSRIYPFKRKKAAGSERWYEKISMSYNGSLRNSISTKEYKFLHSSLLKDWKNGMQHQIPISATFNLFNYINLSPSINYTERWYTNKIEKGYDRQSNSVINVDTTYGFYRVWNYSTSLSASTTVYGFFQPTPVFKKLTSWIPWVRDIMTIRHKSDFSVSLGYSPNFGDKRYGYYKTLSYMNNQGEKQTITYSPFENGMFGVPGQGSSGSLSFTWDNNIEGKFHSAKDTTGQGVKKSIIDKLSFSTSYNMMADSFQWSNINVGLRLKLTKSYSINLNGVFDPYTYKVSQAANGSYSFRRQNVLRIADGKGFGRLMSTGTSFSYTFNNDVIKKWFGKGDKSDKDKGGKKEPDADQPASTLDQFGEIKSLVPAGSGAGGGRLLEEKKKTSGDTDADGYWINNVPWSLSVNYSLNLGYGDFNYKKAEYNYKITNALSFSGNIQPTKNWQMNFNATYDFDRHKISYLTCNLTRNMHCFRMTASFIPVGPYKSYTFSIAVSSSLLKDIKYDRRSNYREGQTWY
ncbi:MAG: LPS-assembly protein LptD [Tannerella sp.]|jgi:hypothetical protein|nr:LPS-assembly protein LptD [Tannerella sp.]